MLCAQRSLLCSGLFFPAPRSMLLAEIMSDVAIKVEGLSKLYRIGSSQNGYRTLRDTIMSAFKKSKEPGA
jgi:hypothetical protein